MIAEGKSVSDQVERWLPVVGLEGRYEVSDRGRVRSLNHVFIRKDGRRHRWSGRILATPLNDKGYPYVHIGRRTRYVHQLVLEAFVGPRPADLDGCHGDGDPTNNSLANLRWDTTSANAQDAIRHGTNAFSSRVRCKRNHLLLEPNLMPSAAESGWRGCLACNRGHATVRDARNRCGWNLDLQFEADKHYAQIMGEVTE